MKILINKDNKLLKDNVEIEITKLNSDFLEEVINAGLEKDLEITIEGDIEQPLGTLFKDIKVMVNEDSKFYQEMHKYEQEEEEIDKLSTEECIKNMEENL